jgi:hypothetical protein
MERRCDATGAMRPAQSRSSSPAPRVRTGSISIDPDADEPGTASRPQPGSGSARLSRNTRPSSGSSELEAQRASFNFLKSTDLGGRVKLCVPARGASSLMAEPSIRGCSSSRVNPFGCRSPSMHPTAAGALPTCWRTAIGFFARRPFPTAMFVAGFEKLGRQRRSRARRL